MPRCEHGLSTSLPIQSWSDLKEVFVGNFQGMYQCPGNPWEHRSCKQKQGESLRDYIRHFYKQCNSLPDVANADIIGRSC